MEVYGFNWKKMTKIDYVANWWRCMKININKRRILMSNFKIKLDTKKLEKENKKNFEEEDNLKE